MCQLLQKALGIEEGNNKSAFKSGKLLRIDGLILEDYLTANEEAVLHGDLEKLSEKKQYFW